MKEEDKATLYVVMKSVVPVLPFSKPLLQYMASVNKP